MQCTALFCMYGSWGLGMDAIFTWRCFLQIEGVRTAKVVYMCKGNKMDHHIESVEEDTTCAYTINFVTPLLCFEDEEKESDKVSRPLSQWLSCHVCKWIQDFMMHLFQVSDVEFRCMSARLCLSVLTPTCTGFGDFFLRQNFSFLSLEDVCFYCMHVWLLSVCDQMLWWISDIPGLQAYSFLCHLACRPIWNSLFVAGYLLVIQDPGIQCMSVWFLLVCTLSKSGRPTWHIFLSRFWLLCFTENFYVRCTHTLILQDSLEFKGCKTHAHIFFLVPGCPMVVHHELILHS